MFFTAELPGKSPLSQIYAAGHGCPVPHTRHRIPRTIPSYNWMSTSFHHCQPSPPFLSLPITSQWVLTSSGHEWRSEPLPDWMLATRCGHRKSPGHSGPFLCPQDHGRAGAGQILTETRPACRVHGSLLLLHTQAHRHTHTHTHPCAHTGTQAHTHTPVRTHTSLCTCTHTHIPVHTQAHTHPRAHRGTQVNTHIPVHTQAHRWTHTSPCTHRHTHILVHT